MTAPYFFSAYLVPEDEGGFHIYVKGHQGIVSQGDTREQAIENIKEALTLMHEYLHEQGSLLLYNPDELPPSVPHEKIDLSVRLSYE